MQPAKRTPCKRIIAVLLVLAMVLSQAPLMALALDEPIVSAQKNEESTQQVQQQETVLPEETDKTEENANNQQPAPEASAVPEATEAPEATTAPAESTAPEASAVPEQTAAPEETPLPEQETVDALALKEAEHLPIEQLVNQVKSPGNTTYYVDAENGSDDNTGISEDNAWKTLDKVNSFEFAAGDKLLLKSGCIWNGTLSPKGSGVEGRPILLSSYGTGARPVINGGGTTGPSLTGAVTIYNEEYWEIENLEVTNLENTNKPGEVMDKGTGERAGILIYSSIQDRRLKHIRVRNCYVHDVNSDYTKGKSSGGIIVMGHFKDKDGNVVTVDDNGNLTPHAMGRAAYEDVIIENNYVKNVAIEGIRNKCNTNINKDGWGKNEFLKNYKDVIIRNNYIEDVVGDGIVLTEIKGGTVEGNIVKNSCGFDRGKNNYAQCWTMFADDVVVQYNEVYGNKFGYNDGEAFDSDMKNERNIFQYNLSHDNGGGACLFMASQIDSIYRYNVSINDGAGTGAGGSAPLTEQEVFHYDNNSYDNNHAPWIYNNTIYLNGADNSTVLFGDAKDQRTCFINFMNNIVLAENGAEVAFTHSGSKIAGGSRIENNCFFPKKMADTNGLSSDALAKKGNLFVDPMLADPTKGLTYTQFAMDPNDTSILNDVKGRVIELSKPYMLKEGSPCVRAGRNIPNAPEFDLFGNPIVGLVDIGAHELSCEPEPDAVIEQVEMGTMLGQMPVLPTEVRVTIQGTEYLFPVDWNEIQPEQLEKTGSFELLGRVAGVAQPAKAIVHVVSNPTKPIKANPITTPLNKYPALPEMIEVAFEGGATMMMSVKWEVMPADQFTKPGQYTVKGWIEALGKDGEVTIQVTVDEKTETYIRTEIQYTTGDTYIQMDPADKNFDGKGMEIKKVDVNKNDDKQWNRQALMQFDLRNVDADHIKNAEKIELRLYAEWAQDNKWWNRYDDNTRWLDLYEISPKWDEKTVTWSTAPKLGQNVAKSVPFKNIDIDHKNFTFDVTKFVKEKGTDQLALLMGIFDYGDYLGKDNANNCGVRITSKDNAEENAQIPAIVIHYPSDAYVVSADSVQLSVPEKEKIVLPLTVKVQLSDKTTEERSVTWEAITGEPKEGDVLNVRGRIEGTDLPAVATVNITKALPVIEKVLPIEDLRVNYGTPEDKLGLPKTAKAVLDSGETVELPMEYWFPEPAYDPYNERGYVWVGYFDLTNAGINNPNDLHPSVTTNVIWTPNKNILEDVLAAALTADKAGEAKACIPSVQKAFNEAYQNAQKVMDDSVATLAEVQDGYNALQLALWNLGYRAADKTALNNTIVKGETTNLNGFNASSVNAFKAALENAKKFRDDEELSVADKDAIEAARKALEDAINGLTADAPAPTTAPAPAPTAAPAPVPTAAPATTPAPAATAAPEATEEPAPTAEPTAVPEIEQGGSDEKPETLPEATNAPETPAQNEAEGHSSLWWILLVLLAVVIIVVIVVRKKREE